MIAIAIAIAIVVVVVVVVVAVIDAMRHRATLGEAAHSGINHDTNTDTDNDTHDSSESISRHQAIETVGLIRLINCASHARSKTRPVRPDKTP
jgi:hypothetical protein